MFIGIRTGYLQNETDIRKLATEPNGIKFIVTTPIDAGQRMAEALDIDAEKSNQQDERTAPTS